MKPIVLGGDASILIEGSPSQARMRQYARLFEELHFVVATPSAAGRRVAGSLYTYAATGRNAITRMFRVWSIASSVCSRVRPHVISTQDPSLFGLVGYVLSRRYRIPLQVQIHTDILSPFYRKASWKERIRYQIALFILPRATMIRAASDRVRNAMVEELGIPASKVRVLPIATDVAEIQSAARQKDTDNRFREFGFRMVSAGRFVEREKNFSLLLDVMVEIAPDVPRPLLVIVGEGPDRKLLERRIRSRGLDTSVVLEPWRDDLPSFLKSFDLFLLPSNFEGYPRVCIEAAAAGLPVVMTDVGSAGELFVDGVNAVVVPVGDRRAMRQAVLRLFSSPQERRRLARAAREVVERRPYRSMADYYHAYREAVEACVK